MRISIVSADLSHNCLGRAYILAKMLERNYEVEILGPVFGNGIWQPLATEISFPFKFVRIHGKLNSFCQIRTLGKKISGKVVYAIKPLYSSYGAALFKKSLNSNPIVLDIDDWEMGFRIERVLGLSFPSRIKYLIRSAFRIYAFSSFWNVFIGERLAFLADSISVSNRYLQNKFGGIIVYHARDTDMFNPNRFNNNSIREHYGISVSSQIIMFLGTPRSHKGVDRIIKAIEMIQKDRIILIIVGVNYRDPYSLNLVKYGEESLGKDRFLHFGFIPFRKVPEFLAMSDIVVIPQVRSFSSIGQTPAKVFDAMSMGKAIVATDVSDLNEILHDCGWVVDPEKPDELREAILHVLNSPHDAREMGERARAKCIRKYSFDAMQKVLFGIFDRYA